MRDYSNRKIDYENRKPRQINYDTIMHIRINKNLKDELYEISKNKKIPISEIVRTIIENYIKKNKVEN